MKAMILERLGAVTTGAEPLRAAELSDPEPGPGQVLVRVAACGVCHTELDEIEGRTPPPHLPVVPGHQAVGRIETVGDDVALVTAGQRVGVGWIAAACGSCAACRRGDDNLCPDFRATGRDVNGGYAELMVVDERYAHPLPDALDDVRAAPLLCAGAIGYRSLRLAGLPKGGRLGLTGFGGSGHLVLQLVRHLDPTAEVHVFARDAAARDFARELGATWAGATTDAPPALLDAIIDTTPAWLPVIEGLRRLAPGGRLVINAIRKEDGDKDVLRRLDYAEHLWDEKEIKSVANVARRDIVEFLDLAVAADLRPEVEVFPLREANRALVELKTRPVHGAKVLTVS